jgi:senataxin
LDSSQRARGGSKDSANEIALLRSELETVRQSRQQKQEDLTALHDNAAKATALDEEIKKLNYRRVTIIQKLDRLRDQQKSDNRTLDAVRRKFRMEVLAEADVICSTLSGSGHDILEALEFEMIIIDEAAQAIELSSLIPLKYNVARCVMVGGAVMSCLFKVQTSLKYCSFHRPSTTPTYGYLARGHLFFRACWAFTHLLVSGDQVPLQPITLRTLTEARPRCCPSTEVRPFLSIRL